jgi:hypothetical protein
MMDRQSWHPGSSRAYKYPVQVKQGHLQRGLDTSVRLLLCRYKLCNLGSLASISRFTAARVRMQLPCSRRCSKLQRLSRPNTWEMRFCANTSFRSALRVSRPAIVAIALLVRSSSTRFMHASSPLMRCMSASFCQLNAPR